MRYKIEGEFKVKEQVTINFDMNTSFCTVVVGSMEVFLVNKGDWFEVSDIGSVYLVERRGPEVERSPYVIMTKDLKAATSPCKSVKEALQSKLNMGTRYSSEVEAHLDNEPCVSLEEFIDYSQEVCDGWVTLVKNVDGNYYLYAW